jgi:hypothetical protein
MPATGGLASRSSARGHARGRESRVGKRTRLPGLPCRERCDHTRVSLSRGDLAARGAGEGPRGPGAARRNAGVYRGSQTGPLPQQHLRDDQQRENPCLQSLVRRVRSKRECKGDSDESKLLWEAKARLRFPEVGGAGELSLAGRSLPLELANRLRKKDEVFSIRTQSEKFSGSDVPRRLFLDVPESGSSDEQSRPRS